MNIGNKALNRIRTLTGAMVFASAVCAAGTCTADVYEIGGLEVGENIVGIEFVSARPRYAPFWSANQRAVQISAASNEGGYLISASVTVSDFSVTTRSGIKFKF